MKKKTIRQMPLMKDDKKEATPTSQTWVAGSYYLHPLTSLAEKLVRVGQELAHTKPAQPDDYNPSQLKGQHNN